MDKVIEDENKPFLLVMILTVSVLGGFCYVVNKQNHEDKVWQAVSACTGEAEENFSSLWLGECESRGLLTSRCISLREVTSRGILDDDFSVDDFFEAFREIEAECFCKLPTPIADNIREHVDKIEEECLKKCPQK